MKMKRTLSSKYVCLVLIFIFTALSPAFAQEKKIRYKRQVEESNFESYYAVSGTYSIESEDIFGQVGLVMDIPFSSFIDISPEGFIASGDFEDFSANIAAYLNMKLGEGGTVPFVGVGIGLNIPFSKTLSTELGLRANIGVRIDNTIRVSVYYSTPIDLITEYNTVGLVVGFQP